LPIGGFLKAMLWMSAGVNGIVLLGSSPAQVLRIDPTHDATSAHVGVIALVDRLIGRSARAFTFV
jgi:hypothetical protein